VERKEEKERERNSMKPPQPRKEKLNVFMPRKLQKKL